MTKTLWFSSSLTTCINLIVSTLMAIMDTVEDKFTVNIWDYAKIQLGCMVDIKHHISWKVNLQPASTYDEDLVSFIKDRVLSPNALQQVTVGLQRSPRRAQICNKITLHLIMRAFLFKSAADICHFPSFDLFKIKPLELNYKEYHNYTYFMLPHFTYFFNYALQTLQRK